MLPSPYHPPSPLSTYHSSLNTPPYLHQTAALKPPRPRKTLEIHTALPPRTSKPARTTPIPGPAAHRSGKRSAEDEAISANDAAGGEFYALTTLTVLALYTTLSNFHSTSPFAHLLPAHDTFPSHPFEFIKQYIEVYKLHTAHISAETAERRRKKVEDVRKRGEYRRAHGLEGGQGLGGWRAKEDGEELGPALAVEGAGVRVEDGEGVYKDWEGRKKPVRKWLGIW
ncbi:MAG: hypothetical protein M1830_000879 [Pleopsidium flavum]|nr:MAG: hypothetical protein M1830_000879 [Pleopsidium flavum]